jgi:hypothetical protein|tara:strand:+ start:381 stop:689 length:309 start_codon:yes stop_codon:yes gene_type:complete
MKTYKLRTNNETFSNVTEAAFDYTIFKNQGGLPSTGDLLSVSVYGKGRGFLETVTFQVNEKPIYDKRDEVVIRKSPIINSQVKYGNAGYRIHRVILKNISLY